MSVATISLASINTEVFPITVGTPARFTAEMGSSRVGKHPAALYRIPGTSMCYTFTFKRQSRNHALYQCQQCKKHGKWTGIKILGDDFDSDPCALDHHPECVPIRTAKGLVERAVYEFNLGVRADPTFAHKKAKPVWHEQMKVVKERADQEPTLRDEMVAEHYKSGIVSRRSAIKRAIGSHVDAREEASMEEIPEHLRLLPDGSLFVHCMEPSLHIYYNCNTVQKAARNGLHTLVADGVHSFQPRQLKKTGQLYTIHGVCNNGVEVPLLYAISTKKTEQVSVIPSPLRIVLDYERASINAAGRVFPEATVQGCAFHLAQAWNRQRDRCGLRPFLEGTQKSDEVTEWWDTIKGLVFLPRRLHREVRALNAPPVSEEHPASTPCRLFLSYLRETWYEGMFSDLWDKHGIEELRTTNLAEAYHSQLNTLMEADHPPLGELIGVLRNLDSEAESALTTLEQNPGHVKYIRAKDLERRERIASEMRRFTEQYNNGISRVRLEEYCRKMSRFVSNKTI